MFTEQDNTEVDSKQDLKIPRAAVAKVTRLRQAVTSHLTKTEGLTLSRKLS